MSGRVGAYVCPRGVFAFECKLTRAGLEVIRSFEMPAPVTTPAAAVDLLARVLDGAGIRNADVAVAIRGFGVVHHVMALPPARDEILVPIVDRELRRLEPQLADAVVAWLPLPDEPAAGADASPQRQLLVAAAPREATDAFDAGLQSAGHRLLHLTALPAAIQRLHDEFESSTETVALIAPLPDGAFLGFFLAGALRLAVEPPLNEQDEKPDAAAMAEEVELGAMFVRQQFRGAQITKVTIAAPPETFADSESVFAQRLGVPVGRIPIGPLSAGGFAALGAILDSQSDAPLGLAGKVRQRKRERAQGALHSVANALLVAAAVVGLLAVVQAFRARDAANSAQELRRRVEQESFGLLPARATADRRKLIRDARTAMRSVGEQRRELQRALTAVGGAIVGPIRMDSTELVLGTNGWAVLLRGGILGETNGRAVQTLHDLYRDLPRRLVIEQLRLEELAYADSSVADRGAAVVTFQLSFFAPSAKKN